MSRPAPLQIRADADLDGILAQVDKLAAGWHARMAAQGVPALPVSRNTVLLAAVKRGLEELILDLEEVKS